MAEEIFMEQLNNPMKDDFAKTIEKDINYIEMKETIVEIKIFSNEKRLKKHSSNIFSRKRIALRKAIVLCMKNNKLEKNQ